MTASTEPRGNGHLPVGAPPSMGKVVRRVTVAWVGPPEGRFPGKVKFSDKPNKIFKFWGNTPFASKLIVGAEGEATFEMVPNQNPSYAAEEFVVDWRDAGDARVAPTEPLRPGAQPLQAAHSEVRAPAEPDKSGAPASGTLTIKKVVPPTETKTYGTVTFAEFPSCPVIYFNDAQFKDSLAEGATAEAVIEEKEKKNGGGKCYSLQSWAGVSARKGKGGAFAARGPSEAELLVSLAAGALLAAATLYAGSDIAGGEITAAADMFFDHALSMVKRGKGRIL